MRFAFRCPKRWDRPAEEGLLWCEECSRHVHDLTVLPDIDPHIWVKEHPDACVRAFTDREGNLLRRIPKRTLASSAAIAVIAEPCGGDRSHIEPPLSAEVCEIDLESLSTDPSESERDPDAPNEYDRPPDEPPGELLTDSSWVEHGEAYVSAGIIVEEPILADFAPMVDIASAARIIPYEPERDEIVERPRKRGLFRRLFGRKNRR